MNQTCAALTAAGSIADPEEPGRIRSLVHRDIKPDNRIIQPLDRKQLDTMTQTGDKTALAFTTKNVPGALYKCLGAFAEHGVNITKLESRPRRERPWEYVFYLDIDGSVDEVNVTKALIDLVRKASFVKVFGSFPKARLPE